MNEATYTMTEEEIKAQGVMEAEDAEEDTITDENFTEAAEKNVWDGEKWVTEAQYNSDILAAYEAQQGKE